ncbi:MAG: sensor histidine kinase [Bacteroidales bacterium]
MNNKSNKILEIAIHASVWIGFLTMPYILACATGSPYPPFDLGALAMPLQVIFIFYFNYLLLIRKFLFRKRIGQFIGMNLLVIVTLTYAIGYLHYMAGPPMQHPEETGHPGSPFIRSFFMVLVQCFFVGLSVAVKVTGQWYAEQKRVQELEKAKAEAELQELKNQLNPHFLFNSLNNIYALVDLDKDKAQVSIISLCEMLRYQLYEANRETISLDKEIEFVRNYCDLMRLRLPRQVSLELDLEDNDTKRQIAPLLFITLVENAFKHGVSQSKPSHISIRIYCEYDNIICYVRNTNFPKTDLDRSGSGIGLDNLKRRLELLYPDRYQFQNQLIGNEYVSLLIIRAEK